MMKLDVKLDSCPICGGSIRLWRCKQVQDIQYRICTCRNCGYGFVNPRPSLSDLQIYYQTQGDSEFQHQTAETALQAENTYPNSTIDAQRMVTTLKNMVGKPGSFLDVGCGYGFFAREAIKQGFQVTGIEIADNERQIAQLIADIQPIAAIFEDFEPKQSFDAIMMSQVLEHAADPILWLSKAHQLLGNDGVIAIAVPNFNSLFRLILQEKDPYVIPPAHLNYFSSRNLCVALEKTGFLVEKIYSISRLPPNFIARKLHLTSRTTISVLDNFQKLCLQMIDLPTKGMFINVFARKLI